MSLDKFIKLKASFDAYINAMQDQGKEPSALWVKLEQRKLLVKHGIRTHYRGIEIKTVKD